MNVNFLMMTGSLPATATGALNPSFAKCFSTFALVSGEISGVTARNHQKFSLPNIQVVPARNVLLSVKVVTNLPATVKNVIDQLLLFIIINIYFIPMHLKRWT